MTEPARIAMWSGPRNISTAMMRSFENRPDTAVIDEPFYAAFLAATGIDHPMRAESLATQPQDWRDVVKTILGPVPAGRPIFYQKHMTHHMVPGFGRDWMASCRNAFLIRAPEDVLRSYTQKRENVVLDDIGFVQQGELFAREAERLGHAPPVVEASDVLAQPRATLGALCEALGIAFSERMLSWPAGPRDTDGVWAKVWYASVERSTGFAPPASSVPPAPLPAALQRIADAARPHYERLSRYRLRP
ncbi:MAG: HAD family hydrolase [Alphaproteobacteria bacterium]|nr:HAD family hydrolase [Alphaproteobacteria bacterium]MBV9692427.1 HAD family hydrolase [Alphaproteobacteria bacterium]